MSDDAHDLRLIEALLFAATEPLDEETLASYLPPGADAAGLLARLGEEYAGRGVNLVRVAGCWAFRTAGDLAPHMRRDVEVGRRLSRAAIEMLAIIAYHQPVTRAEIEEIRGVATSRGTLDILLEAGWIKPRGRRRTPGRPATWVTTDAFLEHFGLESRDDLPGVAELRASGLLDTGPGAYLGDLATADSEGEETGAAAAGTGPDDGEAEPTA